jgi:AraC-like DNA-binding protein
LKKNAIMHYIEFDVPQSLERYLQCAWRLQDQEPSTTPATIYPDGRCELMVHLATPMAWLQLDGEWRQQQTTLFAGQLTTAIRLAARGPVDCLGFRLRPAASASLLNASVAKHKDQVIALAQIDVEFARSMTEVASGFVKDSSRPALWDVLSRRLNTHSIDHRIESAVTRLEAEKGQTRIETLAADQAMSLRSFQSRFQATVGLTAKQFARIIRLQATLRALDSGTESLAELALNAGYSDQSHATRELGQLTGLTPSRLRAALGEDREDESTIRLAAAFVRGRR